MNNIPFASLVCLFLAVSGAGPAAGNVVEVTFSGVVTEVSGGPVPPGVLVGVPVSGRYTYESNAPIWSDTDGVTYGGFATQVSSNTVSLYVGGAHLAAVTNDILYIFTARNQLQGGFYRNYLQFSASVPPGPHILLQAEMDPSAAPLSSVMLDSVAIPTSTQDIDIELVDRIYGTYRADTTNSSSLTVRFLVDPSSLVLAPPLGNPSIAEAGDDRTAKPGSQVTLDGSQSWDPDGNPITQYEWIQAAGPLVTLTPGANVANPSFVVPDAVGSTVIFKLRVSDGSAWSILSPGTDSTASDTVAIGIVANSRPVAHAGLSVSAVENTLKELDGTASFDNDAGDTLGFQWTQTGGPPVTLINATSPVASFVAPFVAAKSATILTFELVVRDNDPINPLSSLPATAAIAIVNANDPPRCDLAVPTVAALWPSDGKMASVGIAGVTDDGVSGLPFTVRITGVRQDEPTKGLPGTDLSPDAVIVAGASSDTVQLRRERWAKGNGRVYTVFFAAHDGWEGCTGTVKVSVPLRRGDTATDDGPIYDSTAP